MSWKKITAVLTAVIITVSAVCLPVFAAGGGGSLDDIMEGLSSFVYKVYKWPESLSVGDKVFSIAESLYTMRSKTTQKSVLWNDSTLEEEMKNFYSSTDWNQFEGMYETVEQAQTCEAVLTHEVEQYESLMDAAADTYGFTAYRELFKAIAQARYNEHKDAYEYAATTGDGGDMYDLFHIDGSWIGGDDDGDTPVGQDTGPVYTPSPTLRPTFTPMPTVPGMTPTSTPTPTPMPTSGPVGYADALTSEITVSKSIDLAAAAFSQIIKEAVFPSPYNTDKLICVVEGFEFGGDSKKIQDRMTTVGGLPGTSGEFISFTEYCQTKESTAGDDPDYDAIIGEYAKVVAQDKTRGDDDQEVYGKYKYSDQKFYQKVFEVYKCTGSFSGNLDMGNLPDDMKAVLKACMETWDSKVTKERQAIIQAAVSLYGVEYDQSRRNQPSPEAPQYLDCSSFTGQAYWRAGILDEDAVGWTTGTFCEQFQQIGEAELIPGDIGQEWWHPGGWGNDEHVGIYIGTVDGVKHYIHCTHRTPAVQINVGIYTSSKIGGREVFAFWGRCKEPGFS